MSPRQAKLVDRRNLAPNAYLYALARGGKNTDVFATISSDSRLHLFDLSLTSVRAIPHAQPVACLSSWRDGGFATAAAGAIYCWDPRGGRVSSQLSTPNGHTLASLTTDGGHRLAAGTECEEGVAAGQVLLFDMRSPSTPLRSYAESHSDTVTQLAFHPSRANLLLSGGTDGLVSLFDVDVADEEDALQQVLNPRAAVHRAGFLTSTDVYVATTDEHLYVYSLAHDASGVLADFGDVRERLQCTYLVNVVGDTSQAMLAYGNHGRHTLAMAPFTSAPSWELGAPLSFPGAHGPDVVRDVLVFGEERRALSCGEDGCLSIWSL